MYKLKWVYICNLCRRAALPKDTIDMFGGKMKILPNDWTGKDKAHFCPECSKMLRENPQWRAEFD